MKTWKRLFAALLALVLMVGMLPPVQTSAVGEKQQTASGVHQPTWTHHLLPVADAQIQNLDPTQYATLETAADKLAYEMSQRNAAIQLKVTAASEDYEAVIAQLLELAFAHNGNSAYGDYLAKHWDSYKCSIEYATVDQTVYYTFNFEFVYFTDVGQEVTVATKIDILFKEWDIWHKSDYEKLELIYRWLCENVRYDYKNLEDEDYTLKYSAYAAIVEGTAVCQGYASAFYRMALLAGVDARLITGIGNGGRHAWNIARLDGRYYNLDATWDEGRMEYSWFLKSNANFPDHFRDDEFDSKEFNTNYPMAKTDYTAPTTSQSGSCGENLTWNWDGNGTLTIEGSGAMDDYHWGGSPWHAYANEITEIVLPEGMTRIGGYAFLNTGITSIKIPDTVSYIGYEAFGQSNLTSVVIPRNVSGMGNNPFWNCNILTEVLVDKENSWFTSVDGVLYSSDMSTLVCYPSAKSGDAYNVHKNVKTIGYGAFYQNLQLKEVVLPEGLVSIGRDAFQLCANLQDIIIPNSVTTIGVGAFSECNSITEMVLPSGLTTIEAYVLRYCPALTAVTIPASVTKIRWDAFANCQNLAELRYAGTEALWQEMEREEDWDRNTSGYKILFSVFCGDGHQWSEVTCTTPKTCINCGLTDGEPLGHNFENDHCTRCGKASYSEGLEYMLEGDHYVVTGIGTCTDTDLVIPDTHNGLPVTAIGNRAFAYIKQRITSVTLPDTIITIEDAAFEGCDAMTNIYIPEGVRTISYAAFWGCHALSELHIPASVTSIGQSIVAFCNNLSKITVDESNSAYCALDGVLYTKDMLTLIAYPAGKTNTSFAIPYGVTTIGWNAFEACYNLTEIVLPETMETIENGGFHNCGNLHSVTIPAGVTYIGDNVFENCDNLTQIIVEKGNRNYCAQDGVLYDVNMTNLICYPAAKSGSTFEIPYGVVSFYSGAFRGARELVSVAIPETVKRLEDYAFQFCGNLKQVFIPASVTYIGRCVFNESPSVTDIYYAGSFVQWNNINKHEQWNQIDWKGTMGEFVIHYGVDCERDGHEWVDASCTEPCHCIRCGLTDGEALGHSFEGDTCVRCGLINYDGKQVKIYWPNGDTYLSAWFDKFGYLDGVRPEEAAVWTVSVDENGYYSFYSDGLYLSTDGTDYTLCLTERFSEITKWELIAADVGYHLRNAGVENQYMYYYRRFFTTHTFDGGQPEQYTFQLIVVDACEAYGHSWSEATCQQERYCTVCGAYGGMGEHNYVGSVCTICGVEHISEGLEYMLEDDHYVVIGIGSCMDSELIIPATFNGLPVTSIENYAFENCDQLTTVILPEGMQRIRWGAFRDCDNLTWVQLPNSLMWIESWAFAYCQRLNNIWIPSAVEQFAANAFAGCSRLEQIDVAADNPWLTAYEGVLYSKDMQTLLLYPAGKRVDLFVVPSFVTIIGSSAFDNCQNLTAIELPEGLKEIGYGAFSGTALSAIRIPNSVSHIGPYAFSDNIALTTVTIPAGVTFVGNGAFMNCENLAEIIVDEKNPAYRTVDGVLYTKNGKNLHSYPAGKAGTYFVVPEGVKTIDAHAFQGCYLTEVVLSNGVTTIRGIAFQHCHELQTVTIPLTVNLIENWAFGGSSLLTEFLYAGSEEAWNAINKQEGWDDAIGEYHVVFYAFCREGHTMVDATCSAPKHCLYCDYTEGDALSHEYENGFCIHCGEVDHGAVIAEGICGDNITWALYEDGLLSLVGQGEMYNYVPGEADASWLIYADQIKSLQIGDSITRIGSYAFVGLTGLTDLIIPADVEYVGTGAFAGCTGLERLYLFGLNSCGIDLFEGCANLKDVFLFHIDFDMTLMYFLRRNALEDQVERMYIRSDLIDISDGEFCTFTCTNAPEYVFVGEYEFVMFTKGNHRWQEMIEQEASCYEWGSAYDYCDLCGAEYNWRELVPMHSYNEDYICTVCGMKPLYVLNCGLQKQDLIKGDDGVYYTKKGHQVLIAVSASIELLDGMSLADFVEANSEYIDMESWAKLLASANEDGYALMTDETYGWFLTVAWEYLLDEEECYIPIFLGFYVDRNCDHVWVAATCAAPKTCVNCGTTDGAPIDHQYENGFCTMCGKEAPVQIIAGGICGDNVYWELTDSGVLSITGFGPMYEGSMNGPETPWMQYADMVREVYIEEGITSLYHYAFANFTNLTTITIPASVEQISCGAFLNCTGLQSIVLYNAHSAYTNSFTGCVNLKDVYVLDAYLVGKEPSGFFDGIGLTTYAERVYMLASLGGFDKTFEQAFSCLIAPEIVDVDGVSYIMYTKAEHQMKEINHLEPTCVEYGYIEYQCVTCGYLYREDIAPTGHSYDANYICTVCGDAPLYLPFGDLQLSDLILGEDGVYYSPEGHIVMIAVSVPLDWYDGNSLFDYVEAYGDTYFSLTYWRQLLKATNKDGYAVLTEESLVWILDVITGNPTWGEDASYLPFYLALQIDRTHTHQYETVVVAPTCTENGYTIYTCSCGERYIDNVTPALGHKDQDKDGMCDNGCGTEVVPDPDALIITAESVRILQGNWATVTLWVEQNPGFQGMSFYPVIRNANGEKVSWTWDVDDGNSEFGFDVNVGTMIVLTADEDCTGTGVLLDVVFFVGEDVEIGEYTISFQLYRGECFNAAGETIAVELPAVEVEVVDFVYGDANGDRIINLQDVLLLRRHLANRDPETNESSVPVEAGADANGDNIINLQDVLLLRRYLANRDPDTGESPIVLGPQ